MKHLLKPVCMVIAAAVLCISLDGCANMPANPFAGVNLAVSPDDPCGGERARFAHTQTYFTTEIAIKVIGGALIGAGTGAVVGAVAGGGRGSVIGAVAGAGAGAAAGFAAGYWQKLQQTNLDQQALAHQVDGDVRTESSQMSEIAGAFSALRTCRFAHAQEIKLDVRRGRLARADADSQLAQERGWFNQEVAAAQQAGLNMQKRDDQFAYAANQLPARSRSRSDPAAVAHTTATETIPQKRNSFENTVSSAEAQSSTTFSLDTSTSWLEPEAERA